MNYNQKSREWQSLEPAEQELIIKHQQKLPVKVSDIAREFGVAIKASTLAVGISGEIKNSDGQFLIRVNRHDSKPRQRFTVAHELAHFLLHKEHIGDGIRDDILYRSSLSDTLEAQANRLAADILMPIDLILSCIRSMQDKKDEEKYEIVAGLAEVSTTALKIRLGKA